MKILLLLILAHFLTACMSAAVPVTKENSELYSIPIGSEFVLHQSIQVEALHARAFIQNGQVITEKRVHEYYPYCEVEVQDVKDSHQIILPNRFTITKITDDDYEASRGVLMASLQPVGDGPLFLGFASEYYVQSEKPSGVFRITCLHWDDANLDRHVTVSEIRQTLGAIISLVLKPDSI